MPSHPAITGAQIRAARAFLNWTVEELSRRCGVSVSAISRAERFDGPPSMQLRNLAAIRTAFERGGIELIDDAGVKLRRG